MLLNVREVCNKGVWFGTIGRQSNTPPYNWIGFKFPEFRSVEIKSINMSAATFNRISEETLFTSARISLLVNTEEIGFDIIESKIDTNEMIDNSIEVPLYIYFGIDEVEVKFRFMNEALRIMKGSWASINGISETTAIKNYLIHTELRGYFEINYPEMLI